MKQQIQPLEESNDFLVKKIDIWLWELSMNTTTIKPQTELNDGRKTGIERHSLATAQGEFSRSGSGSCFESGEFFANVQMTLYSSHVTLCDIPKDG